MVIPSRDNTPTHVYWERALLRYTYIETIIPDKELDYFDCYVVSDDTIHAGDLCLVTDPDGFSYPEQCALTIFQKDSNIFYGREGTRCLLCDVQKMIATTNKALQSDKITALSGEEIRRLFEERRLKYYKPNFFEE